MIVAIQPDFYSANDASSPIWIRCLREAGHEVREVDVYQPDILDQLKGCQGFMWRHAHVPQMRQIARRLLPVIECELGLTVYPDQATCWHYDDKIAQAYLFRATGIPMPETWTWFDRDAAMDWSATADYPLVLKLWAGAGSTNVRLVADAAEAAGWIERLFERGVANLDLPTPNFREKLAHAKLALQGELSHPWELHKGYALFQEFLPDNAFDTRVTVIGNRAFGFRRFNRQGDFRASGSGKNNYDPKGIAPEFVRLAFEAASKLRLQSCAIDGLWRGQEAVVGELSYTYVSWAVKECPGYWDADMNWHEGQMWPEEAQIRDFLVKLNRHCRQ